MHIVSRNRACKDRERRTTQALLLLYEVPYHHIHMEKIIATGAFGEVWRGRCRGKIVAIKKIIQESVSESSSKAFFGELRVMAILQENGICHRTSFKCTFCSWDRDMMMVIEFCEIGALDDVLSADARRSNEKRNTRGSSQTAHRAFSCIWPEVLHVVYIICIRATLLFCIATSNQEIFS